MASATVEMIRASELRNRRNIGGFFGADRIRPIEYFIAVTMEVDLKVLVGRFADMRPGWRGADFRRSFKLRKRSAL
jgi:hypothetical protein